MLLGVHLTLLVGPTIAVPAPPDICEALTGVSVTQNDRGRSGFQLTFEIGRTDPSDLLDYKLLLNPLLRPFTRVVMMVTFGVVPEVIMDGVITNVQFAPSNRPGRSVLTVTGEDVSVMMDMNELTFPWPAMSADNIVRTMLLKYAQYGVIPMVMPALYPTPPVPTERVPVQTTTDYKYALFLAERQGYVFYFEPGPAPNVNTAYWGPPQRVGLPQKALTFNAGPETNTRSLSFKYDALSPTIVMGRIQDAKLNTPLPVITPPVSTRPPLALMPALLVNQPNVRQSLAPVTRRQAEGAAGQAVRARLSFPEARTLTGLDAAEAALRAQATLEVSNENVVTVTGEIDSVQYGAVLRARSLVGVRGVGFTYGGNYYVQSVTHSIKKGEYKQSFTLAREGTGPLIPVVRP